LALKRSFGQRNRKKVSYLSGAQGRQLAEIRNDLLFFIIFLSLALLSVKKPQLFH
jgi:hypothetical protein